MKITKIVVTAGRSLDNPFEEDEKLRPRVKLEAELHENDNPKASIAELQAEAEQLVDQHKNMLLDELKKKNEIRQEQLYLKRLERNVKYDRESLRENEARLEELKRKLLPAPEIVTLTPNPKIPAPTEDVSGMDDPGDGADVVSA